MQGFKDSLSRIHDGLGKKEQALFYFLVCALVALNSYAVWNCKVRYDEGSRNPITVTQSIPITRLPPFALSFCYPGLIGALQAGHYDGTGPGLATGTYYGNSFIVNITNAQSYGLFGVDFGEHFPGAIDQIKCTGWVIDNFTLDDAGGKFFALGGIADWQNYNLGVLATYDLADPTSKNFTKHRPKNNYYESVVRVDWLSGVKLQPTSYTYLNGSTIYSYNIEAFDYFQMPDNTTFHTPFGDISVTFLIYIIDSYVNPLMQATIEIRSFTYSDVATTVFTFFNISFTVIVVCFPRQYLVASVQSFFLNPKPVYDPHSGTLTDPRKYRLPPKLARFRTGQGFSRRPSLEMSPNSQTRQVIFATTVVPGGEDPCSRTMNMGETNTNLEVVSMTLPDLSGNGLSRRHVAGSSVAQPQAQAQQQELEVGQQETPTVVITVTEEGEGREEEKKQDSPSTS